MKEMFENELQAKNVSMITKRADELNIDENMYSLYFKEIKKDVHLYVFEEMVLRLKFLEDSIAGKEEIIFPKLIYSIIIYFRKIFNYI